MRLSEKTRRQLQLQKYIFILLFSLSIGLLAWLSNHYSKQFDLTSNHRHSLSQNSIDLLKTFNEKITVHAYVVDKATRKAVEEIFNRYQQLKPDIKLEFFNPDIDFEQAKKDAITLKNNIAFVIHYKNRQENIHSLSENSISNALYRLGRKDNQTITFLTGHNERNPFDDGNRSYGKLRKQLEKRGFNINAINLLLYPLTTETQLLVIAAPEKKLIQGEIDQIKNYLDDGGSLIWLVDIGKLQGMQAISRQLGIELPAGVVVDNNTNLRQTLNIKHPAVIPVVEYPEHPVTRALNYTLFPIARGINIKPASDNWHYTPLLQSLPRSWIETGGLTEEIVFESKQGDIPGPITIGLVSERHNPGQRPDNPNNTTSTMQRIAIIGDSDFMANSYIGAGDNMTLALNLFNWLSHDDKLLSITPKQNHDLKLELNDTQLSIIAFGFFIILPAVLLISGFTIWYRRNKR